MSLWHVPHATLPGSEGPFYPPAIDALVAAFTAQDPSGMSDESLSEAARGCADFVAMYRRGLTADGYTWRQTVMFSGGVRIALPWGCDDARKGKTLDRSPAVYISAGVDEAAANSAVERFAQAMHKINER